jgi:hypothetical protein
MGFAWRQDGWLQAAHSKASHARSHGVCHAMSEAKEQARPESSQTGEYCMTGVLVRGVTG